MKSSELTVVIPCKNEGNNIIAVLTRLKRYEQEYKIIVADSSDDNITPRLLSEYAKHTDIIITEGGSPSVARNNGAKLVTTPYVLFLDADIYLNSITITRCLNECIVGNYDLVTCKFTTDLEYDWVYKVFNIFQWISSKTSPFCLGGFMLFKVSAFNELKGFNEEAKVAEDYHLSSKVKCKKFKIFNDYVYTPSRRFEKKGVWYMIKLAFSAWINRKNEDWFKNDHNYWK